MHWSYVFLALSHQYITKEVMGRIHYILNTNLIEYTWQALGMLIAFKQLCILMMKWCYIPITHRGLMRHTCISKLTITGSDNGLSPGRRQAIIWTNAGILLIWTIGKNFSEILSKIHTFSFKKMHLKMSVKWPPFFLNFSVMIHPTICTHHRLHSGSGSICISI